MRRALALGRRQILHFPPFASRALSSGGNFPSNSSSRFFAAFAHDDGGIGACSASHKNPSNAHPLQYLPSA